MDRYPCNIRSCDLMLTWWFLLFYFLFASTVLISRFVLYLLAYFMMQLEGYSFSGKQWYWSPVHCGWLLVTHGLLFFDLLYVLCVLGCVGINSGKWGDKDMSFNILPVVCPLGNLAVFSLLCGREKTGMAVFRLNFYVLNAVRCP